MKKTIKAIIAGVSTFNISLKSFIKIILFSKYNVGIKSIKDSGECYILGNGPSLKSDLSTGLDLLKTKKLFVVNDFSKSEYYEILKPEYYVFADPSYWSTKVNIDVHEACILVLQAIRDRTSWPISVFVPHIALKTQVFQSIFSSNKNIKIIDFNDTTVIGFQSVSYFFYKKNLGIPPMKNVLIASIYLSINMGFNEISILGSDHSWTENLTVNEKNQVCLVDSHFYDKTKEDLIVLRHIYGDLYKMHQILRDYAQMFEGYHLLREYADYLAVRIYNRCTSSFIDAFERKDFNK